MSEKYLQQFPSQHLRHEQGFARNVVRLGSELTDNPAMRENFTQLKNYDKISIPI